MLQPYFKQEITQKNLFYLHLVKEVYATNSSVILQSLHKLLECNTYLTDHFIINGKFFINFNTDKFTWSVQKVSSQLILKKK